MFLGPWAGVVGARALGMLGHTVVSWVGDALGVCSAITVVFCCTTLVDVGSAMLGAADAALHGVVWAENGGVVGSSRVRMPGISAVCFKVITCPPMCTTTTNDDKGMSCADNGA